MELAGGGRGDLRLADAASQLVIVEAKLGSPLSPGTRRVPGYDQAARNVGCLAHAIAGQRVEMAAFYARCLAANPLRGSG